MTDRPDFHSLIVHRLEHMGPLKAEHDMEAYGHAILRQLQEQEEQGEGTFRMSALGSCLRKQAFKFHGEGEDGRSIDARARTTFAMGDMAELFLLAALDEGLSVNPKLGWTLEGRRTEEGQDRVWLSVELEAGTIHIPGHRDGLLVSETWGKRYTVECKSTSSYGFKRWQDKLEQGDCPWDQDESYWWQAQAYMAAEDTDACYVLALSKDSGATLGFWLERDHDFVPKLQRRLDAVATHGPMTVPRMLPGGTRLEPVVALHKTTGRPNKKHGTLPWQCRFCNYHNPCWGDRLQVEYIKDYRGFTTKHLKVR
jgi:hypothetical protein